MRERRMEFCEIMPNVTVRKSRAGEAPSGSKYVVAFGGGAVTWSRTKSGATNKADMLRKNLKRTQELR